VTATSQYIQGTFTFVDPSSNPVDITATVELQLFFPQGRVAGGTFWLATFQEPIYSAETTPLPLGVMSGLLDASLGAANIQLSDEYGCYWYEGALVGPDDGFQGTVHHNPYCGSDIAEDLRATGWLRSTGEQVPPGALEETTTDLVPTSSVAFYSTVPMDMTSAMGARMASGQAFVDGTSSTTNSTISFAPAAAFRPNEPETLLASPVDVLGRALTAAPAVTPLQATTPITDLSLATAPPDMSYVNVTWNASSQSFSLGQFQYLNALVNLGDPGANTRLHVRLSSTCQFGSYDLPAAAAVTADGQVVALTVSCQPAQAMDVSLPAPGPVWIAIQAPPEFAPPVPIDLTIDQLGFDP
jgi:hypothetical protein